MDTISNDQIMLSPTHLLNHTNLIEVYLSLSFTIDEIIDAILFISESLTGFKRVVAYQFSVDWNGEAIAEINDKEAKLDSLKGLWFPASDIPIQGRNLYDINKVI